MSNIYKTRLSTVLGSPIHLEIPEGFAVIHEGIVQEGDQSIEGGHAAMRMSGGSAAKWIKADPIFFGAPIESIPAVFIRPIR